MKGTDSIENEILEREEKTAKAAGMILAGNMRMVRDDKIKDGYMFIMLGGDRMMPIRSCNWEYEVIIGNGLQAERRYCSPWVHVYTKAQA